MRNDFAVEREQRKDGKLLLCINTKKAVFRGMKWSERGDWGKRKMENMLFLTRIDVAKDKIKIFYV